MKRVLVPVRQQSLCIFCASRLAQQRSLHSGPRKAQETGTATRPTQREDAYGRNNVAQHQVGAVAEAWGGQGGGWNDDRLSPSSASSQQQFGSNSTLSPEEQRIRQNLQETKRFQQTRHQPPIRKVQFSPQTPTEAPDERHTPRPQGSGVRDIRSSPLSRNGDPAGDSPSGSPGFRVTMRRTFSEPQQHNSGSRENAQWAQLKRRNAQSGSASEVTRSATAVYNPLVRTRDTVNTDSYIQGSQLRQEQAKSAQFVGFDRKANVRCYQCGQLGHSKAECPQLPKPFGEWGAPKFQKSTGRQNDQATPAMASASLEQHSSNEGSPRPWWQQTALPSDENTQESDKRPRASRYERATTAPENVASRRREDQKRTTRNIKYAREAAMLALDAKERAARRRAKELRRAQKSADTQQAKVSIPAFISIGHLATLLNVRASQFERSLKRLGFTDVNHDHVLNAEDASLIAQEYDFVPVLETGAQHEDLLPAPEPEDSSTLPQRPPVVTIMGHVDHGKTTILDYVRKSSIAANEHGGITQHIGAFSVPMSSGKTITFLDTPGHAAFLTMRQRGANVTDIVILVVAADDSVMPQTLESINCAKTAGVPMIVAINKMDKEDATPERVKQDLARHGVELEEFGGDTQVVYVSGKTGLGMEDLEETISTLSEILDQRADSTGVVEGWILEASTKKSGRVATILVRRGTLKVGDIIVAGTTWARVRTMRNEFGVLVDAVGPGMPAEIDGWRDQPSAGDEVLQAPDEQKATAVTEYREALAAQVKAAKDMDAINTSRRLEAERRAAEEAAALAAESGGANESEPAATTSAAQDAAKGPQEVYFTVKGDVSGSVEAVINQVSAIGNAEIRPVILHSAVGPVNQGDVERASLANGYIIAFNTTTEPGIHGQAERAGVGLIEQSIIYRVTDEVKALLESRLPPEIVTKVTGEAEIAQPFSINVEKRKFVRIAGSKVKNGTVNVQSKARVLRAGEVVYTGVIASLRNKKQAAQEMRKGSECGISFDGWEGFEIGDQIQCFEQTEKRRTL